jgi:hypothetical protein
VIEGRKPKIDFHSTEMEIENMSSLKTGEKIDCKQSGASMVLAAVSPLFLEPLYIFESLEAVCESDEKTFPQPS